MIDPDSKQLIVRLHKWLIQILIGCAVNGHNDIRRHLQTGTIDLALALSHMTIPRTELSLIPCCSQLTDTFRTDGCDVHVPRRFLGSD